MLMFSLSTGVMPMKKLSLFVSAFALCASTSYAAINCGTLPSCDSLGYTDTVANCPSSAEVLKCPFDTTKGKCQRGPAVGDLKYSLNTANHNGWILCNGQGLDTTKYAALYNIIGSNYGMDGTKFRVPDYRGFFLRAYGTATNNKALSSFGGSANSSLKDPQKEELPNITGEVGYWGSGGFFNYDNNKTPTYSGVFKEGTSTKGRVSGDIGATTKKLGFDASISSSIYKNSGHVIPANYAANIFIYAGR